MQRKLCYVLLLITVTSFTNAQSKNEKAVATAVASLRQAMIDSDSVMLDKLTAFGLSYGHSSGKLEDKPTFIHSFTSGSSDFVTIDLTDQTITMWGKTAVVRHALSATTNDNGKPGNVKLLIMTVWQKQHGNWKLIARQAVRPPQ